MTKTSASSSIVSAVLRNGDQLDLIRGEKNSTSFLHWSGGSATKCAEFQSGRRRFTLAEIGDALPREIRLATGVSDYKSVASLFNSIADVFRSMCALEQNNAEMATFFAFATYFAEFRDPAPRAIVTATDTREALQAVNLLGPSAGTQFPQLFSNPRAAGTYRWAVHQRLSLPIPGGTALISNFWMQRHAMDLGSPDLGEL